jgi:hypothetical protein
MKQYYGDKWTNFALVLEKNGDFNNAEELKHQETMFGYICPSQTLGGEIGSCSPSQETCSYR